MYLSPADYKLSYTPIAIQFVPSLLLSSGQPQDERAINLIIHSPSSKCVGIQQTTKKVYTLTVPTNGTLVFSLASSGNYTPRGRYRVEFKYQGATEPFDEQFWIIPGSPKLRTVTIPTLGTLSGSMTLNDYPGGLVTSSLGSNLAYTLLGNQFNWTLASQAVNNSFSITYQPAVTLDQIIDLTHKPKQ